jgi:hypothetical protein
MQLLNKREPKPTPAATLPSGRALWRLNAIGLLTVLPRPGKPISRRLAADVLERSREEGWWEP